RRRCGPIVPAEAANGLYLRALGRARDGRPVRPHRVRGRRRRYCGTNSSGSPAPSGELPGQETRRHELQARFDYSPLRRRIERGRSASPESWTGALEALGRDCSLEGQELVERVLNLLHLDWLGKHDQPVVVGKFLLELGLSRPKQHE